MFGFSLSLVTALDLSSSVPEMHTVPTVCVLLSLDFGEHTQISFEKLTKFGYSRLKMKFEGVMWVIMSYTQWSSLYR